MRILNSIQSLIIEDDIALTKKDEDKKLKSQWRSSWEKEVLDGLSLVSDASSGFFLCEHDIIEFINSSDKSSWLYLMAMEALLFTPYYFINGYEDQIKDLKKLKFKSEYLFDRFVSLQGKITKDDFSALQKAYRSSLHTITGSSKNLVIGAIGTTVAIAATGGLALTLAPAIATAIVGESIASLSGAALVSYSLAAIGGGSLAAGGLGMAGGTAIITGGGALIGLLGGTGISAATTVNLLSDDGYVLSECCKLLLFSKEVLAKRFQDLSAVKEIQVVVESRMREVRKQIDIFSDLSDKEPDEKKKKEMKVKVKVAKKSLKYLSRTEEALKKLVKGEEVEDNQTALLTSGITG